MAVGSWVGSDIFPTLEPFENIIASRSQRGKGKGKAAVYGNVEETKAAIQESNDDMDFEWKGEDGYD